MKYCYKCRRWQPAAAFPTVGRWRRSPCNACRAAYARAYRASDIARLLHRRYMRRWRLARALEGAGR